MTKILNIFYAKTVIAPVLDEKQNFLKESLISTYLTSTPLLFIERHDQFFVLNRIWTEMKVHIFQNITSTTNITKGLKLQKMKTDVKKKKIAKCPTGCQSLPQKLRFFIPLQPMKIKSLILCFARRSPPTPSSQKNYMF